MYFVYCLKSEDRNYIYVGITENIERRFNEHQLGKNKTTKPYRPFVLFYSIAFESRIAARQKEIELKSGAGKEFLKSMLKKQIE